MRDVLIMRTRLQSLTKSMLAWLAIPCVVVGTASAQDLPASEVRWSDDGRLTGTVVATQGTGGVTGNYWTDLSQFDTVGQTFRCEGPVLAGIQMGLADADLGYRGLTYRTIGPKVTIRLRRTGPRGEVVAQRVFTPDQIRPDLYLPANLPSSPEDLWYVEISADSHTPAIGKENTLNASWVESYPDGQMHLNGRPAEGDLHMRIHRRFPVDETRVGSAVLWSTSPQTRVWMEPDRTWQAMLADDPQKPIMLSAAGREWATTQVVLTPREGIITRAKMEVSSLVGPADAAISPQSMRIERLRYLQNFRRNNTTGILYPDPLEPASEFEIEATADAKPINQTFVISIEVPHGSPAGVYQGQVTITLNDGQVLRRAIELRVHGFSLPVKTHTRTGLFSSLENKTPADHLAMARDMASFRISIGYPFHWDHTSLMRRHQFNEEGYRNALSKEMQNSLIQTGELLESQGLAASIVTPWADTYRMFRNENPQAAKEGMIRFWQTYYPILESRGWLDQFHARMIDEVKGDKIRQTHEIAAIMREHAPQIKLMVTAMGTPDVTQLAKAIGIADIWCPSSRYMAKAMDFYQSRMKLGEEVWPYIHDHAFLATEQAGPRLFFWMLQKYGFGGACYFSVSRAKVVHTWFGLEQHTDTWAGDGDLYFASGQKDQPLWRSLRLHLMREGIEDREYFVMMHDLARQAREKNAMTAAMEEQIRQANEMLDQIVWGPTAFSTSDELLEQTREHVANVIVQLQAAVGSGD